MKRALLIAPLLLAGCMNVLFPYKKPETVTPEQWREAPGESVKQAWPDAEWWKGFNSAELTGLIEQAKAHNFDIAAAVARVKEANAEVKINGSTLLPSLDATADATHSHGGSSGTVVTGGSSGGTTTTTTSRHGTSYNAGLNAAYELDFWGKNLSALEAAKATRAASEYDREVVILTVESSVATTYFDLLATRQRLAIANNDLKAAQEILDALKKRFAQGVASELDVTQQASVVDQTGAAIPPLKLEESQDLDALAVLVGELPESLKNPNGAFTDIASPDVPEGLPSQLLERRPDVQEAEAQLIAAHANINNARAQFFPDISLTGEAGYASSSLGHLFSPGGFLLSVGGSALQPIFEGGLLTGQLSLTKAQYEELESDYHKSIVSAFSDVENALAAVKDTADLEKAQDDSFKTARRAYELSQQQFNSGIVDITAVLNTQRTLYSATDALAQARLSHLQAIAELYVALGGGWAMRKSA